MDNLTEICIIGGVSSDEVVGQVMQVEQPKATRIDITMHVN